MNGVEDIVENELNTGDYVLFTKADSGLFNAGEVERETPKSIVIKYLAYGTTYTSFCISKIDCSYRCLKINKEMYNKFLN